MQNVHCCFDSSDEIDSSNASDLARNAQTTAAEVQKSYFKCMFYEHTDSVELKVITYQLKIKKHLLEL